MEDLILDFNLYLCEKFGYRNSCSVMQNANGFWLPMDTLRDKIKLNELWESKKAPWKVWDK
jgi:NDP-sugar pyrophosphorylase family protein